MVISGPHRHAMARTLFHPYKRGLSPSGGNGSRIGLSSRGVGGWRLHGILVRLRVLDRRLAGFCGLGPGWLCRHVAYPAVGGRAVRDDLVPVRRHPFLIFSARLVKAWARWRNSFVSSGDGASRARRANSADLTRWSCAWGMTFILSDANLVGARRSRAVGALAAVGVSMDGGQAFVAPEIGRAVSPAKPPMKTQHAARCGRGRRGRCATTRSVPPYKRGGTAS